MKLKTWTTEIWCAPQGEFRRSKGKRSKEWEELIQEEIKPENESCNLIKSVQSEAIKDMYFEAADVDREKN